MSWKRKLKLYCGLAVSTIDRCRAIKHALNLLLCRFESAIYGHYEHRKTDRLNHCYTRFEFATASEPL